MKRPRRAAATLAHGWTADGRRWNLGSSMVLAATLVAMIGTAGLLDGTRVVTLERVSDFYTGDLRITPYRAGNIPNGWFDLNSTAVGDLGRDGVVVSSHVEAQFFMSRLGLFINFYDTYAEKGQIPVETPGTSGEDANRTLIIGGLVGIEQGDPANERIARHLIEGRLPRPTTDGTVEVAMSVRRLEGLLTPQEREGLPHPPPLSTLCHRSNVVRSTSCEITSAQTSTTSLLKDVIRRPVDIVGLFETRVDDLDDSTLVAAAPQVRELLGHPGNARIANVLLVQSGASAAQKTAEENNWATEDATALATRYVGQLIAILTAVVLVVGALLFLMPTFLVSHGISRQLALQQRELAVCTAIGVPRSILRGALALQVVRIAAVGVAIAATVSIVLALVLPMAMAQIPGVPFPVGFSVSLLAIGLAVAVTVLAMVIGWGLGVRSQSRLPLTAQLRSA